MLFCTKASIVRTAPYTILLPYYVCFQVMLLSIICCIFELLYRRSTCAMLWWVGAFIGLNYIVVPKPATMSICSNLTGPTTSCQNTDLDVGWYIKWWVLGFWGEKSVLMHNGRKSTKKT